MCVKFYCDKEQCSDEMLSFDVAEVICCILCLDFNSI